MTDVTVGMLDGSTETWTAAKDGLHHVEVAPSGALLIYTGDGEFRAARSLAVWLTVDVTS